MKCMYKCNCKKQLDMSIGQRQVIAGKVKEGQGVGKDRAEKGREDDQRAGYGKKVE